MKVSFHNHSTYSDGDNTLGEMAQAAYENGFTHFAFTDHLFIPGQDWTLQPDKFTEYVEEINILKEKYHGKMKIISGIEADWSIGGALAGEYYKKIAEMVDMTVGSVHVLKGNDFYYCIDSREEYYEKGIKENFGGNVDDMLREFFMLEEEIACVLKPDLMAHVDIIRLNNYMDKYFSSDSSLYEELAESLARKMKENNMVTEVNGGGAYRRGWEIYYPGNTLLNMFRELDVPITIGLDAHSVDMTDSYYDISLKKIVDSGYKHIAVFENGIWQNVPIEEFM